MKWIHILTNRLYQLPGILFFLIFQGIVVIQLSAGSFEVGDCEPPSILLNPQNNFTCEGGNVQFSITAAGTGLTYQWLENGMPLINGATYVGVNEQLLHVNAVPTNLDLKQYSCLVSGDCGIPVTSFPATLSVGSLSPPAIVIDGPSSLCAGQSVTYIALMMNAGLSPVYDWKVNDIHVGGNETSYSTNTLSNGNKISCSLTANDGCSPPVAGVSNVITVSVIPLVLPSISISTINNPVCQDSLVRFVSVIQHGGSMPKYDWFVNSSNKGVNQATYTTKLLNNRDTIYCKLTSNAGCRSVSAVYSNKVIIEEISINRHVLQGDNMLYAEAADLSYQWINCNTGIIISGEMSREFIPLSNGNYAVIITDRGCVDTSDCIHVELSASSDINALPIAGIFPNPVFDFLNITLSEKEEYTYQLTDMIGRKIKSGHLMGGINNLDLRKYVPGYYLLSIMNKEEHNILKLVKK